MGFRVVARCTNTKCTFKWRKIARQFVRRKSAENCRHHRYSKPGPELTYILAPFCRTHVEMELNLMRMTWHCWYECDLQSKRGKKRKEIVIATERKLFERSVNFRSLRCHPDDNHIQSQRYFDWHFRIIIFMIVLRTWFIIGSLISRYNL